MMTCFSREERRGEEIVSSLEEGPWRGGGDSVGGAGSEAESGPSTPPPHRDFGLPDEAQPPQPIGWAQRGQRNEEEAEKPGPELGLCTCSHAARPV